MQFRRIQWFVLTTILTYLFLVPLVTFSPLGELSSVYAAQLVFVVFGLGFLYRHNKSVFEFTKLNLPPWWSFFVVVPLVIANLFLASFLTSFTMLLTRQFGLMDIPIPDMQSVSQNNLVLVLSFSLLPGIVEEFYCRGVLFHSYQETISTKAAIFWSALAFSLMHFNLWNVFSPMVGGVIFALLTIRFDSVIPAMFAHSLFNLLVMAIEKMQSSPEFSQVTTELSWNDLVSMLPITLASLFIVVYVFVRLGLTGRFQPAKVRLRWYDHVPSVILLVLFIGLNYLIQKGLGY